MRQRTKLKWGRAVISGGSSDAISGAADQGDGTVEHNERGEAAIDGAVAAGDMARRSLTYPERRTAPSSWGEG